MDVISARNISDQLHDIHIKEVKKRKSNARVISVRTDRWRRRRETESPKLRHYKKTTVLFTIRHLYAFCCEGYNAAYKTLGRRL